MANVTATNGVNVYTGTGVATGTTDTSASNDVITFTNQNQLQTNDVINGGDGIDTLRLGTTINFTTAGTTGTNTGLRNLEVIDFGGAFTGTFRSDQYGAGLISNAVTIQGVTTSTQTLAINMAANGSLDMSGWSWTNWTSGTDIVNVTGSTTNDTLKVGTVRATFAGGTGQDTINFSGQSGGIALVLNGATNATATSTTGVTYVVNGLENVIGSAAADTLTGDTNTNILMGGAGNDIFIVSTQAQLQTGDVFNGGADADTLQLNASIDFTTAGTTGTNTGLRDLEGININGAFTGTFRSDQFGTGLISDAVTIQGATGTQTLAITMARGGSLDMSGWTWNTWTSGTDVVTVNGSTIDDVYKAGSVRATFAGGTGQDTIDFSGQAGGVTLTLNGATNATATSTTGVTYVVNAVENVVGSSANDTITGDAAANFITGGAGNDTLNGGGGDDVFILGAGFGTDTITGGETTEAFGDNIDASAFTGNLTLTMTGAESGTLSDGTNTVTFSEIENVFLGGGTNTITASGLTSAVTLRGKAANDTLTGGSGADTLIGDSNILINGSFEVGFAANTYSTGPITGWKNASGDSFEIWGTGFNGEVAADGTNFIEIDNDAGLDTAYQDVATEAGKTYNLTFSANQRDTGNESIEVWWNGSLLDTITPGANQTNYTYSVSGSGGIARLEFRELASQNNNLGVMLDNVSLTANGNDSLNGGAGADTLIGGAGSDTYYVDNAGDVVVDRATDAGTDLVYSSITFAATGANQDGVDNITLTGATAINATGNGLANIIIGNTGNNTLTGGGGNDTLTGGLGNDTLVGGTGADIYALDIINTTAAQSDTVKDFSIADGDRISLQTSGPGSFETLSRWMIRSNASGDAFIGGGWNNNGQTLTLTGVSASSLTANQFIFDTSGTARNLTGTVNADMLVGALGNDTLAGGDGNDFLLGDGGTDILLGGNGNDVLDGGTGADTMTGGSGNDVYYVDHAGDVVNESVADGGIDQVDSWINYALTGTAAGVEKSYLRGTADINLTGNNLNNSLYGNSGHNQISGGEGNDQIFAGDGADVLIGDGGNDALNGEGGNDILWGGFGDDVLDGGTGADQMTGGAGNDAFVVDSIGDIVSETVLDGGTDTVKSWITFALAGTAAGVENAALQGTANIDITGNDLNNALTGNAGDNRIDGGDGADTLKGGEGNDVLIGGGGNDVLDGGVGADQMTGGAGNDTYTVDNLGDAVFESVADGGTDTVKSWITFSLTGTAAGVENGALQGTANIDITGNALNNALTGNAGDNRIDGGDGVDTLKGGAGNDVVIGGNGNDTLYGDDGADLLIGGAGNDKLYGGNSADTFQFAPGNGTDTIADFAVAADKLDLTAYGIDSAAELLPYAANSGANLKISFTSGDVVILQNVQLSQVHDGMFVV